MFPAFAHFRRTAMEDTEIAGRPIGDGDKVVMWYVSSNRDESRYEDPDRFDVHRNPEHQAFGAGGRHFCLGAALARLELRVLFEETLRRFPEWRSPGKPDPARLRVPQSAEDPARPLVDGRHPYTFRARHVSRRGNQGAGRPAAASRDDVLAAGLPLPRGRPSTCARSRPRSDWGARRSTGGSGRAPS